MGAALRECRGACESLRLIGNRTLGRWIAVQRCDRETRHSGDTPTGSVRLDRAAPMTARLARSGLAFTGNHKVVDHKRRFRLARLQGADRCRTVAKIDSISLHAVCMRCCRSL
jgi:hypothetical protein